MLSNLVRWKSKCVDAPKSNGKEPSGWSLCPASIGLFPGNLPYASLGNHSLPCLQSRCFHLNWLHAHHKTWPGLANQNTESLTRFRLLPQESLWDTSILPRLLRERNVLFPDVLESRPTRAQKRDPTEWSETSSLCAVGSWGMFSDSQLSTMWRGSA